MKLFLPHPGERAIVHQTETEHFSIVVEDDPDGFRHLVYLPRMGSQTVVSKEAPSLLVSNFGRASLAAVAALDGPPRRALFLGMGGGAMPERLRAAFPSTEIDIVELDAAIPGIAREFFGFVGAGPTSITIMDARLFLRRSTKAYDVIFIDVYNALGVPYHVATREFFELVGSRLEPGGLMAMNLAVLRKDAFIPCVLRTVRAVFPDMAVMRCPGGSNYVPIAGASPLPGAVELKRRAEAFDGNGLLGFSLAATVDWMMAPEDVEVLIGPDALVLTDDYAPTEFLSPPR